MKLKTLLLILFNCFVMNLHAAQPPTLPPRKKSTPMLLPRRRYLKAEELRKNIINLIYANQKEEVTSLHFSSFERCAMESIPDRSEAVLVCDGGDGFMVKKIALSKDGITSCNAPNDSSFAPVACSCSGDGTVVAFGTGKNIILYTVHPWNSLKGFLLSSATGDVEALALNRTGKIILFSHGAESHFTIRNIDNSIHKEYKNNVHNDVYRVAFSPNEQQFISVSKDKYVIWDIKEDGIIKSYESRLKTRHNCKIEYCGDTEWFLTGYEHILNVWVSYDLNKIEIKKQISLSNQCLSESMISLPTQEKQGLYAYDRSSCGKYIFVEDFNKMGSITIFNLDTTDMLRTINTKNSQIFSMLYVPEGKLLVAGIQANDSEVSLYDFINDTDQKALALLPHLRDSDGEFIQKVLDPLFDGDTIDMNILLPELQELLKKYIPSLKTECWVGM